MKLLFLFEEKFISLRIVRMCILFKRIKYMRYWLKIFIGLIMIALGFMSCSPKQETNVLSHEFDGEIWHRFDYLEASFNVVKAPMTADLVLEIEVSDNYPDFYNYHADDDGTFKIAMTIDGPDGSSRSREYLYRLKDKEGNFKSQKVDKYYRFELPLINEMSFREKGKYVFSIENKYSKEPLCGVKRLSINCVQIKK